jgi:tol-pal system beta propeller repeat protein TolB
MFPMRIHRGWVFRRLALATVAGILTVSSCNDQTQEPTEPTDVPPEALKKGAKKAKIAFVSDRDAPNDRTEIYIMNPDGRRAVPVTSGGTDIMSPAWSPDRSKIAFSWRSDIYVINADGSGQTNLTNDPESDRMPAWSPDGSKIAFTRYGATGGSNIFVMNADGTEIAPLTTNETEYAVSPDWSPDGGKIVFTRFQPAGSAELYVMNANGSGQTNLAVNGGDPDWSPDGRKIAFFNSGGIAVMNADGSDINQLTNNPDEAPTWSPDGRMIAFASLRDGASEVYVMNADGSGQTNLTNHWANDTEPNW